MQTLESLRGSAQILEERNKKLETLCNGYLHAAKEARAAAQLEREKCKVLGKQFTINQYCVAQALNSNFKKRLHAVTDSK